MGLLKIITTLLRWALKLVFLVVLLLAIVLFVITFASNSVLNPVLSRLVESQTGFVLNIEDSDINIFQGKVAIKGLTLENPRDFSQDRRFVSIREVSLHVEPLTLLSPENIVVNSATVDIAEFAMVTNQEGVSNIDQFKSNLDKFRADDGDQGDTRGDTGVVAEEPKEDDAMAMNWLVKKASFTFDKLVIADYSGGQPNIDEYNIGLSETLTDVRTVGDVIKQIGGRLFGIALKVAIQKGLKGIGGIMKGGGETVGNAIEGGAEGVGNVLKGVGGALGGLFGGSKETTEQKVDMPGVPTSQLEPQSTVTPAAQEPAYEPQTKVERAVAKAQKKVDRATEKVEEFQEAVGAFQGLFKSLKQQASQ